MLHGKREPEPRHVIGLVTDHQVHDHGIESWFVRRDGDVQIVARCVRGRHTVESHKFVSAFAAQQCRFSLTERMREVAVTEVANMLGLNA